MSYQRTLLQLRKSLARRAGIDGPDGDTASVQLTATVLNELLNDALQETYDILVQRWEDYYTITGANQTMAAGVDTYVIPTDFYKLRKVEVQHGSGWSRLRPFDLDSSHHYRNPGTPHRYRQQARNLILAPVPSTAIVFRLHYIPIRAELVTDADTVTFDVPNEQKLLLAIAWRDCLDAQELDPSPAIAKVNQLVPMLKTAADGKDATEPFYLDPNGPPLDTWDGEDDWGWW